jgi:hypothetical protein
MLLALPLSLIWLNLAWAANAPGTQSKLTPQQEAYQQALKQEFDAFVTEFPTYMSVPENTPEELKQRRDLGLIWQERARVVLEEFGGTALGTERVQAEAAEWQKPKDGSEEISSAGMLPNEAASNVGPPDQNNASLAYSEILPEVYGVWTEHIFGFGMPLTQVWYGGTPAPGSGVAWSIAGGITAPMPTVIGFTESWNPTMAGVPPIGPDQFYMAMSEWVAPALSPVSPSAIVTHASAGSGSPFPSGSGPGLVFQGGGGTWVDYPYLIVDDHPGNMGPPGLGDAHVAWVEYFDVDGDPNGNGIFYDDPADFYNIWVASANTLAGPMPYPNWGNYWVLWSGPVLPWMHQAHRPSLSAVGPAGTPLVPPSGVYVSWFDGVGGIILVEASPQPGSGAPWTVLGPTLVTVPVTPLPFMLNGNIKASTSVTIGVDNGPLFSGMVYVAWSDYATGDADIMFTASATGGLTWSPPVRVNQDPVGNGADQWAPHMMVDINTGEIKITYYDRRNDPAGNLLIETFASSSLDGGVTWTDWIISDVGPMPPVTTLAVGPALYVGDYLFSDFNWLSGYGAIWNDGRNGGDQDVYFEDVQTPWGTDSDGDGIPDAADNCPAVFNPNQAITIGLTGDVLPPSDGLLTAADIIYLVNYVFKSGPMPNPCQAAGDVTCDGAITAADVIFLVNHVFKGGPPPCNICLAFGLGWTCP